MREDEQQIGSVNWGFFGFLATMVVLTGVATYYLLPNLISKTKTDVTIVKALEAPIKVRPAEPGGKAVDHQNLLVVDILKGGTKVDDQTETLRPTAPSPEPPPVSFPKNELTENADKSKSSLARSNLNMKITNKTNDKKAAEAKINDLNKADKLSDIKKNTARRERPEIVNKSTVNKRVIVIEGDEPLYMIQLAAFRDAKKASEMARILSEKHKSRLKNVELETMKVNTGSNGIFHRIVSIPLPRPDADKVCGILRRSGQDCFLRKHTKANP